MAKKALRPRRIAPSAIANARYGSDFMQPDPARAARLEAQNAAIDKAAAKPRGSVGHAKQLARAEKFGIKLPDHIRSQDQHVIKGYVDSAKRELRASAAKAVPKTKGMAPVNRASVLDAAASRQIRSGKLGIEAGIDRRARIADAARRMQPEAYTPQAVKEAYVKAMSPSRTSYQQSLNSSRARALDTPVGKMGPSRGARLLNGISRLQTPLALSIAAGTAYAAYKRAYGSENKTRKEALIEAGKAAAPTVGAVALPHIGRVAGYVGDGLIAAGHATNPFTSLTGIAGNALLDGVPAMLSGGAYAAGAAAKLVQGAGWVAGKAALPIAVGMAGYEAYKGIKSGYAKSGVTGAAVEGASGLANSILPLSWLNEQARKRLLPNGGKDQPVKRPWYAPVDAKKFSRADASFRSTRGSSPIADSAEAGRKKGWSPQARIASARSRGVTLPYGGDPGNYVDPNGHS